MELTKIRTWFDKEANAYAVQVVDLDNEELDFCYAETRAFRDEMVQFFKGEYNVLSVRY